jgi:pyruvate dehydrogenase E2 component (dihydrolipoamide acetyltransferase)
MATPIIMPRQGQSVESCIIAKWHKKKGDSVAVGDMLFSYETDKASFDEEAKVAGTLLDIFFEEGDDVPCLINVCVIGNPGESTAEFNPNGAAAGAGTAVPTAQGGVTTAEAAPAAQGGSAATGSSAATAGTTAAEAAQTAAPATGAQADASSVQPASEGPLKISPRARNLAERSGVDYRYANASGPNGRIIEKDIIALKDSGMVFTASARAEQMKGGAVAAAAGTGLGGRITTADLAASAGIGAAGSAEAGVAPAGAAEYEEAKLPNIRKVIAKAMQQSLSTMAQLTLNSSFDVTDVMEFRKKLKESKERLGLENITINDIIIYAVSRTLSTHKDLNAHFLDDRMLYFKNVHIGVAVDTDRGLMVPTLFNANLKSLNKISAEVKKLVKDCQTGTINPDLLKGGTFTITNLGTLDIESFTPVINPPQTAILGVNNIVQRAREVDGEIEFYPAMGLSLTFDHRALDGAPAARFLKDLKTNLESFSTLLVK